MRSSFQLLLLLTLLGVPGTGNAQTASGADPAELVARLAGLELAASDTYRVRDLTLRRDVLSISLTRGVLAFLEPVDGRVTGAVYVGTGEVVAIPPDEVERRQIYKFTGSPILNERFDAAIFRFTDDTYAEVLELLRLRAREEIRTDDLEALLPWGENLGESSRLLNFRLLQDLLGPSNRPVFFAALRGERLGWFDVAYDLRSVEEVAVGATRREGPQRQARDIWASFNRRSEARDPTLYGTGNESDVDVISYEIDTRIDRDGGLTSRAAMRFVARQSGERVLAFSLTKSLRLREVRLDGESIPFFQHDARAGADAPGSGDRFVLVLPRPMTDGEEIRLEFDYAGGVLERRGNGVYYVSERILWYPHPGVLDPARYELRFHFPSDRVLVATGERVEEEESGGLRHSIWTSGGEFVVAGFNYGDFSIESDETGPVPLYVHVNNDVETVFEELAARRAANTESALRALQPFWGWRGAARRGAPIAPDYDLFSTRRLAANVVRQVGSIVEFFEARLGAYPFGRLSVSQFPVAFSQGWPSLLYVSTFSFFDAEQRARLGLTSAGELRNTEYVLAHEAAHQWFGNSVSWRSYRDQWIGEGFANYMALLYLEEAGSGGASRSRAAQILADLGSRLQAESRPGETFDGLGPVWLGQRLATASDPEGYHETVYAKATWIVHMLRMLMREEGSSGDDRFFSMVREFLGEFGGRAATTWDLKAVAENHLGDRMDLEGDGTLDWFFDQWVFGTGIPDYAIDYDVAAEPTGGFRVEGRVTDRLGLDFTMPLPLYARTRAGEVRFLGDVVVSGNSSDFGFVLDALPIEILLDPERSVLRR